MPRRQLHRGHRDQDREHSGANSHVDAPSHSDGHARVRWAKAGTVPHLYADRQSKNEDADT